MSDDIYMSIHNKVGKIVSLLIPNGNKLTDRPPLENLLDLERTIDKNITYNRIVLTAEKRSKDLLNKDNAANKQKINNLETKKLIKMIRDEYKKERV